MKIPLKMSSMNENTTIDMAPTVQSYFAAGIFATTSFLGIPGNILVIVAVGLSQKLQTSTNIFVVALAVTDLLTCLLLPVQVMSLAGVGGTVVFNWVCCVVAVCLYVFLGFSVSTLTLIAYNRYYMITKTGRDYHRLFTKRNMALMLLGIDGFIFIFTIVFAATGIATFGYHEGICAHAEGISYTYISGVWLICSLIIIVVCYVKIYQHIKYHLRNIALMTEKVSAVRVPSDASAMDASHSAGQPKLVHAGFAQRQREIESKITTNMLIVIILFFVCVSPSILTLIVPGDQQASAIIVAIITLNSCLNPLVYAWKHPVFRHVFRCILSRNIAEIKEPTQWARSLNKAAHVNRAMKTESDSDTAQ